jgi:hypothetical protein
MTKPSRVGQKYPLRTSPLDLIREDSPSSEHSHISNRTARYEQRSLRRELKEAQNEPLTMSSTTTSVQRPLTATQQRAIRSSAEPDVSAPQGIDPFRTSAGPSGPGGPDDPGEPSDPGEPDGPGPGGPDEPSEPDEGPGNDEPELSNADLARAILALSKGKAVEKATPFKPKAPDAFDGSSDQKLRMFIFQCQNYFNACRTEFADDKVKICFAISYLRDAALDYFEPFINESGDMTHDFFESWPVFVQKLTNLFGSYSPEDDDEDAIVAIPFPHDGKAATYFIEFAKYQNRIEWNDRSLRKVVKDSIPSRITNELRFAREDTSTFQGMREAVLRIDNDFWKRKRDEANKQRLIQNLQSRLPKSSSSKDQKSSGQQTKNFTPQTNQSSSSNSNANADKKQKGKAKNPSQSNTSTSATTASSSTTPTWLGPDGKLTMTERLRRMKEGLCLICGKKGHLIKDCPKNKNNTSGGGGEGSSGQSKGRAATTSTTPAGSSQPKN